MTALSTSTSSRSTTRTSPSASPTPTSPTGDRQGLRVTTRETEHRAAGPEDECCVALAVQRIVPSASVVTGHSAHSRTNRSRVSQRIVPVGVFGSGHQRSLPRASGRADTTWHLPTIPGVPRKSHAHAGRTQTSRTGICPASPGRRGIAIRGCGPRPEQARHREDGAGAWRPFMPSSRPRFAGTRRRVPAT
jgi:hypothetical protein